MSARVVEDGGWFEQVNAAWEEPLVLPNRDVVVRFGAWVRAARHAHVAVRNGASTAGDVSACVLVVEYCVQSGLPVERVFQELAEDAAALARGFVPPGAVSREFVTWAARGGKRG